MTQKKEEFLDIKQFFYRIASNWLLFILSILLCLAIAFGFNRYTKNIFKVSSTILFEDQSNISSISAAEAIYSNDPFQRSSKNIIANKIYEINSYPLIYQTLNDLNYDIEYYLVGNIKVSETYQSPFTVKVYSDKEKILNRSFKLTHLNDKKFRLYNKSLDIDSEFSYNQKINFLGAIIKISRNINFATKESELPSCVVKFKELQNLTKKYQSDLSFTQEQKKSSIVKIDLKCFHELKGVNFLNKLTENFIQNEVNSKNLSSIKTVEFIKKQLFDMQDSLEIIENEIQLFKERNGLADVSVKAQGIYSQLNEIESKINILKSEKEYLSYLSSYIQSESKLEQIKIPPSTIDENSSIRTLIKDLIEVQFNRSLLVEAGKLKNPAVKLYDRTTNQIISSLNEAIFTSNTTLDIEIKRNNKIIKELNSEINKLPEIERELLKIQRVQTINENIYTFLLRKKSEADITSSSNIADTRVLEPAVYFDKNPFLPNKSQNYLLALLAGFVIPLIFFLILDILNDKILSRFDLDKHSTIPVLGIIGTNRSGFNLLSKQSPKSVVYEGFRAIRSNLNFKIENNKNMFVEPSYSRYKYISISKDDVIKTIPIDNNEIFQTYQTNLDDGLYSNPNKYEILHVLIDNKISDDPESPKIEEEIYDELKRGASFENVISRYDVSSESKDNLGYMGKFILEDLPAAFSSVILTLQVGQISEPFISKRGIHIISLKSIEKGDIEDYDNIKLKLEKEIKTEKGSKKYYNLIDEITDAIYSGNNDLLYFSELLQSDIKESQKISVNNGQGVFSYPHVREELFKINNTKEDNITPPIFITEDRFILCQMIESIEQQQISLKEARPLLLKILTNKNAKEKLSITLEESRDNLNAGLKTLDKTFKLFSGTTDSVEVDNDLKNIFFNSNPTIGYQISALPNNKMVLFNIKSINLPSEQAKDENYRDFVSFSRNTTSESDFDRFYKMFRDASEIEIRESLYEN